MPEYQDFLPEARRLSCLSSFGGYVAGRSPHEGRIRSKLELIWAFLGGFIGFSDVNVGWTCEASGPPCPSWLENHSHEPICLGPVPVMSSQGSRGRFQRYKGWSEVLETILLIRWEQFKRRSLCLLRRTQYSRVTDIYLPACWQVAV